MKRVNVFAFLYFLIWNYDSSFGVNLKNNACTKVESYHNLFFSKNCYYNPDVNSKFNLVVGRHGYNLKTHEVTTDDGFILPVFEITSKTNTDKNDQPIFLMHGQTFYPDIFITYLNESLAFELCDQGYVVYVGNFRGTQYTRHTDLPKTNQKFWNYTYDTLAEYDFPAQIDLIYSLTNKKVLVIGHSIAPTIAFMYNIENPDRASQTIKGIIGLATVVYLKDVQVLRYTKPLLVPYLKVKMAANRLSLVYPEQPFHNIIMKLARSFPEFWNFLPNIENHFLPDIMLLFWSYWPSSTSVPELNHFFQIADADKLQKYDYGTSGNQLMYGTDTPPVYDLSKVQVPVSLFYGLNDYLVVQSNMDRLLNELGSTNKEMSSIPQDPDCKKPYGHIDLFYGGDVEKCFHPRLFSMVEKLSNYN